MDIIIDSSQTSELCEENLNELVTNAVPASTYKSTKWGATVFMEWCLKRDVSVNMNNITSMELNDILRWFYAEAKTKSGCSYTPSAMTGIRAAIQRFMTMPPFNRSINLINDREFIPANKVFSAKLKKYVSDGNAKPKHKPTISDDDMALLGKYFSGYKEDPCTLQDFVWFSLCYYFGRRGREGWRDTQADTYVVREENGERFVVENKTQITKNWQGGHKQADMDYSENRMCNSQAVEAFELFIEKRNKKIDAFFQTPLKNPTSEWYKREPLGKNKLANIMKNISQRLLQIYTSHCVRASTITRLFQAGIPVKQICAITKHKNESSLNHYISGMSTEQKKQCGAVLENAF